MEVSGEIYTPEIYLGGRGPVTHYIGGRVGPTAGLDTVEKREISCPFRKSKHSS
jgi:hypothetical protein